MSSEQDCEKFPQEILTEFLEEPDFARDGARQGRMR